MRKFLLSGVALLASFGAAHAAVLASGTGTASASIAAPAGTGTPTPFGPVGAFGGWAGGLIPFVSAAGAVTITVSDCCLIGDVFQVSVDGIFIGESPSAPLGGSTNSVGVFTPTLSAGPHVLGIEDITLSYLGFPSPFGGINPVTGDTLISDDYDPAGMRFSVTQGIGVSEPMTIATLCVGLLGLVTAKWRRKQQASCAVC